MYVLQIWKRSRVLAIVLIGMVLVTVVNVIWLFFHPLSPAQVVLDGVAAGVALGIGLAARLLAPRERAGAGS